MVIESTTGVVFISLVDNSSMSLDVENVDMLASFFVDKSNICIFVEIVYVGVVVLESGCELGLFVVPIVAVTEKDMVCKIKKMIDKNIIENFSLNKANSSDLKLQF